MLGEAPSSETGRSREEGGHSRSKKKHQEDGNNDASELKNDEKTTYMAVSEQRYEVVRRGVVENSALVTGSDDFSTRDMTKGTKNDFSLDTACSKHAVHNHGVFTSYETLNSP